jgi:hypothetical protein
MGLMDCTKAPISYCITFLVIQPLLPILYGEGSKSCTATATQATRGRGGIAPTHYRHRH